MNYWKAEFTKAGELALASGTLLVLGWVLFLIGKGFWGVAIAPEKFDVPDMVAGGILATFLTTLFLAWHRGDKVCAVFAAFALNLVGSCLMGQVLADGLHGVDWDFPIGQTAGDMFIALLILVLGLLLLWLRFSRTVLSPIVYLLGCVLLSALSTVSDLAFYGM